VNAAQVQGASRTLRAVQAQLATAPVQGPYTLGARIFEVRNALVTPVALGSCPAVVLLLLSVAYACVASATAEEGAARVAKRCRRARECIGAALALIEHGTS
jgi:hypothetical protein